VRALSALRGYSSAALLGVAAIVFLVIGAPGKTALAGTGFAFVGAAVTRTIDLARERQAASVQAAEASRRDLDETRRLAYAMLSKRPSERDPVLVATVLNALVHHGLAADYMTAMPHLTRLDSGQDDDLSSTRWLQEQIRQITHQLES
jgi:hypothetical protein